MSSTPPFKQGFTLLELMVTVSVIAVLCTVSFVNLSRSWRQERLLNTTRELETWLEQQRQYATKNNLTCTVTFEPEEKLLLSRVEGTDQGTTKPCNAQSSAMNGDVFDLRDSFGQGHQDLSLTATPQVEPQQQRGGVHFSFRGFTQNHQLTSDGKLELRLKLDGVSRQRCIRIISPIGMMRDGSASDSSAPCQYQTAF